MGFVLDFLHEPLVPNVKTMVDEKCFGIGRAFGSAQGQNLDV